MRLSFVAVVLFLAGPSGAITFSFDLESATLSAPDSFLGYPLDAGDIITPAPPAPPGPNPPSPGPLPTPGLQIAAPAGGPGTPPGGLGLVPGAAGAFPTIEVDALSYGQDAGDGLVFSVDEWAVGVPSPTPSNVLTEGAAGVMEASADVFWYLAYTIPAPPGPVVGNTARVDGDGVLPSGQPGTGLIEPNPPLPGLATIGDTLDALDIDTTPGHLARMIFFSMDGRLFDPLEGFGGSGTAPANGFSAADIVVSMAGGAPVLYAPASALGLDPFDDDVDAIAVADDGDGIYTPGVDSILFSVRRGSFAIGMPDSTYGAPIEEGDVLMPPTSALGGPAIFISAEALGLATVRSGTAPRHGDELDALDLVRSPPACNDLVDNDGDGLVDAADDPGCDHPGDDTETSPALVCDNGSDDDGDGLVDLDDPACSSGRPARPDGLAHAEETQCDDALDVNGDGILDNPGADNDGMGDVDWDGFGSCSDGVDNDGDGNTDGLDPDCISVPASCPPAEIPCDRQCRERPWKDKEAKNSGCGMGIGLALLMPALLALRQRSRR